MIVVECKCNRCGKVIKDESIKRYGTQPVSETDEHLFLIKHRFSGGEKEVHRWRSDVFCEKCTKRLEKVYLKFVNGKKRKSDEQ